ncbi:MAG: DUF190 domain-containing protein [Desulfobacterales bacterium]|nr:DUF190 domain-containing protein [Desulfobacterales bacterium]
MQLPSESLLLRIFIGETDKFEGRPLYKAIVEEARKQGMAGATVLRGMLGFGANSRIHTSQILRLSEDLPLIIEIVDSEEKINAFLPLLDEMINEGLVTLETARVITYRHNSQNAQS